MSAPNRFNVDDMRFAWENEKRENEFLRAEIKRIAALKWDEGASAIKKIAELKVAEVMDGFAGAFVAGLKVGVEMGPRNFVQAVICTFHRGTSDGAWEKGIAVGKGNNPIEDMIIVDVAGLVVEKPSLVKLQFYGGVMSVGNDTSLDAELAMPGERFEVQGRVGEFDILQPIRSQRQTDFVLLVQTAALSLDVKNDRTVAVHVVATALEVTPPEDLDLRTAATEFAVWKHSNVGGQGVDYLPGRPKWVSEDYEDF